MCYYAAVVLQRPSLLVGPLGVAVGVCLRALAPCFTESRRCLEWNFQVFGQLMAYPRFSSRYRGVAQRQTFGRHHLVEAVGVSESSLPGFLRLSGLLRVSGAHRLAALGAIQHELGRVEL